MGGGGVLHRAGDARHRRLVVDDLHPAGRALRHDGVGAVALDELDVGGDRGEVGAAARVQVVHHPHPVPALHQRLGQMAADEPGASGDEDLHAAAWFSIMLGIESVRRVGL
jgi:hypothetical protein